MYQSIISQVAKRTSNTNARLVVLSKRHITKNEQVKQSNATSAITSSIDSIEDLKRAQKSTDINFENSQIAFKSKSNLELLRGLLVFQLCSISPLVDNQHLLMKISRTILGKNLFSLLMKSTFYGHFVAGENQLMIKPTIENMLKYNVRSILDYSVEDDLNSVHGKSEEDKFDKNMEIFIDCVDAVVKATNSTGFTAIKTTSLVRPQLLVKLSTHIKALLDSNNQEQLKHFEWSNLTNSKMDHSTIFSKDAFSSSEIEEFKKMIHRLHKIMQQAHEKNVKVFVDAEQTYFQDAIRLLAIKMMKYFNKNKCIVFNTYQNYLKSCHRELSEDLAISRTENFQFGAKLVRGAYMEQERPRAKEYGYEDPINTSYEATTQMYERNLLLCMNEIKTRAENAVQIMVASHNEDTVRFAVEKMKEFDIKPTEQSISFGQLLGMCDYISFSLGSAGYSVYKYTPFGPVEEVLPYLSRRAIENRGIFDKVKKEKRLLANELKRRVLSASI